jgi:hypothetical protein
LLGKKYFIGERWYFSDEVFKITVIVLLLAGAEK